MSDKKIVRISYGSTYDEVKHLLDSPDWTLMDTDGLMECADSGHQAKEYAEHDDVIQVGGTPLIECRDEIKKRVAKGDNTWDGTIDGNEVCMQVRCPNCKSWFYWDYPAYTGEEIKEKKERQI